MIFTGLSPLLVILPNTPVMPPLLAFTQAPSIFRVPDEALAPCPPPAALAPAEADELAEEEADAEPDAPVLVEPPQAESSSTPAAAVQVKVTSF